MKIEIMSFEEDVYICLPDDLMAAASVESGDYLDVEINHGTIILSKIIPQVLRW